MPRSTHTLRCSVIADSLHDTCTTSHTRGLLQRSSRQIAEVYNWHFTACAECSSSSRHKHRQVRPWPVESTSSPVALVQSPRANRVQACCHGSPVSEEQSSDVLERPLHSGQQPTPTISQPAAAVGESPSALVLSLLWARQSGTHY